MEFLINSLESTSISIPNFVYKDLEELSYEYFSFLQWYPEMYSSDLLFYYKHHLSDLDCDNIKRFLRFKGKELLINKIKEINGYAGIEEHLVNQILDDYISAF